MRVLLIEDDFMLGEACQAGLRQNAYAVDWVQGAQDAYNALRSHIYEVILLDLGLPDGEGSEILKYIRENKIKSSVIIMTARDQVNDKITCLDLGADDYLVKPVDLHELCARIRAVSRRTQEEWPSNILDCNGLKLDLSSLQGWYNGKLIDLGSKEFRILQKLIEQKGKIVSKEQLETMLYSWGHEIESNAIEVHIYRIRKKTDKSIIRTIRAGGYTIEEKI